MLHAKPMSLSDCDRHGIPRSGVEIASWGFRCLTRVARLSLLAGMVLALYLTGWAGAQGQTAAPGGAPPPDPEAVARGQRVYRATGGCGCHTDRAGGGQELAGGRGIKTPFGTFYATNITPDRETGLGAWSEADFIRAMREGIGPDGTRFFPVFPYTSFTRMSDGDLKDLWAYLRAQPSVRKANRSHDVWPPFGWRIGLPFWQWQHLQPGALADDPAQSAEWNRGRYLVRALGHCAECHTPRGWLGGLEEAMNLAGAEDGPEGQLAPNITPDTETGLGRWSKEDVVWYLGSGQKPDGDDSQGLMAEMIEHGLGKLGDGDREAIAVYLKTVPPVKNRLFRKKP